MTRSGARWAQVLERSQIFLLQFLFVALLFAMWEAAVASKLAPAIIYGQPSSIFLKLIASLRDGSLLRHSWVTFEGASGWAF